MISEGMNEVLVLEDDVDFEPDFRQNLQLMMNELNEIAPTWDLA